MSSASGAVASEQYEASLAKLPRGGLLDLLFELVWIVTLGWWGELPEPRHRVVVHRRGEASGTGVAEARTLRKAQSALAEVERELATLTAEQFIKRYRLSDAGIDQGPRA